MATQPLGYDQLSKYFNAGVGSGGGYSAPAVYASPSASGPGGDASRGGSASRDGSGSSVSFNSAAYGGIPAPTPMPKSTWEQTQTNDPGLYALNDPSNALIKDQMAGQLSPETIKSIQDNAATFGVTSGMPGSGLQGNAGLRNLGLNVEQYQNQGLQNYLGALKTVGGMQLDPSVAGQISAYNNALAAAPNPAAAAAQEEALWQQHFKQSRTPAGGTTQESSYGPVDWSGKPLQGSQAIPGVYNYMAGI